MNTISDYSNPSSGATVNLSLVSFTSTFGALGPLAPTPYILSGNQVVSTTGATNANTSVTLITVTFAAAVNSQSGTVDAATVNANGLDSTTAGACVSSATHLGCSAANGGGGTGFRSGIFFTSAARPNNQVPEPATFSLVGRALAGLGFISRKR